MVQVFPHVVMFYVSLSDVEHLRAGVGPPVSSSTDHSLHTGHCPIRMTDVSWTCDAYDDRKWKQQFEDGIQIQAYQ